MKLKNIKPNILDTEFRLTSDTKIHFHEKDRELIYPCIQGQLHISCDIQEQIALELLNSYRICCFSSRYDSILMWSHYADENKGICVEYDLGLLDHSNPILRHIYPVIYGKDRVFKLDVKEISEITGVKASTVQTRLQRGRKLLEKKLDEGGEEK